LNPFDKAHPPSNTFPDEASIAFPQIIPSDFCVPFSTNVQIGMNSQPKNKYFFTKGQRLHIPYGCLAFFQGLMAGVGIAQ
jgi:hypothetical protein